MTRAGDEFDDEDDDKSRTGRFSVLHRGGTRVEVGEPVKLPDARGGKPWMCAVKLVGPAKDGKPPEEDEELTATLLVRTGRGHTPDEAQRDAMAQLSLVYGTPTQPPPPVLITSKLSEPPAVEEKKTFWGWVKGLFGKGA